jgi:CD63 antigen
MVTTFSVLLGIVFLLEIVAGALGFAYKKKVEDKVKDALDKAVDNYFTSEQPGAKDLLDWAQQKFECCGRNSSTEYKKTGNITCPSGGVASCYSGDSCTGDLYTEGCQDKFVDFVKHNLAIIGAVAIGIAFIQLLGIIFACCLMKSIKGDYEVV